MPVVFYTDTDLDFYGQFDDDNNTRVVATEGTGDKLRRYEITDEDIAGAELPTRAQPYSLSIRNGDIEYYSNDDPIFGVIDYFWNGTTQVTNFSGGGILSAQIGVVSLTSQDFLEIVQGEEKIVTFIVEAHGRFDREVFDTIIVKWADSAGTTITKTEEESIERVCQALDVQVIRCTLSAEDTASLVAGLLQIELAFDSQKARLTHSLKIIDQILEV